MKNDVYYTAFDKDGNMLKQSSIDDVPVEQRDEAFMELMYREDGNEEFANRLNVHRREKAMQAK